MWRENAGSHPPGKERDACLTPADGYANVAALIEQDHRGVKLHIGPMLGLERFRTAAIVIAGIELLHRIRKGQFNLARLRLKDRPAPAVWDAVLSP
jgi:transposase-like protein